MEWFNTHAPGFMYVGCKPHPFGNKRYMICCGLMSILWRYQITEGKYRFQQLGQKEYNKLRKALSLMLRMCRHIFVSGKAVVFDSGFCVDKGLTDLKPKGVYAAYLIKKWHY